MDEIGPQTGDTHLQKSKFQNHGKLNNPNLLMTVPLQVGQQIPRLGSGGFGSVQFKVGHVGGRQVTTPR